MMDSMSVYDPFSQGTDSNPNPESIGNSEIPSWPEGYTLYSHIEDEHQGMVGAANITDMIPQITTNGDINNLTPNNDCHDNNKPIFATYP